MDRVQLERLRVFLNRVMSDDEIMANPRFNENGMMKIARHMNIPMEGVPDALLLLSRHLASELREAEDSSEELRYTYEEDTLGGITVRDTHTGKEKFLGVQQAVELIKLLSDNIGTEQETLAAAMNESVNSQELAADEISSETSIFNFPWKLNESSGFAAAQYSGFGSNFAMKIISVVDHNGNTVDNFDPKSLSKIARRYINEA